MSSHAFAPGSLSHNQQLDERLLEERFLDSTVANGFGALLRHSDDARANMVADPYSPGVVPTEDDWVEGHHNRYIIESLHRG